MIHTIAQKTADIFCRQNVADEEKKEIYIYGIELLVSSLIGAVLILGISIGIGKIWSGVKVAVWFILLGAYIIMAVLAPVENKNKPLDDEEVKKYKWKSIVIYSAFIMVVLAADITGVFYEVCLYIKIILIIIAVLMVLGKFKENLTE